jgi:hypothetical protein
VTDAERIRDLELVVAVLLRQSSPFRVDMGETELQAVRAVGDRALMCKDP